jgi:hypothetical protein
MYITPLWARAALCGTGFIDDVVYSCCAKGVSRAQAYCNTYETTDLQWRSVSVPVDVRALPGFQRWATVSVCQDSGPLIRAFLNALVRRTETLPGTRDDLSPPSPLSFRPLHCTARATLDSLSRPPTHGPAAAVALDRGAAPADPNPLTNRLKTHI